ncbi:MAG TPA: FtsX-like permease family protein [Vicinamibacterales bacterium]|nr:FtsX-like permease family protein [Vicinamibacterales bacterium]
MSLTELRGAWHGVRSRGWRAGLEVALLAVALAANTIVFSAADAYVFRRVPYPAAARLIELDKRVSSRELVEWRRQTDLFAALHGYATRPVFLQAQGQPEIVDVADVTPGLIDALGVSPAWGRAITDVDAAESSGEVVVISEDLARRRFGSPASAVGRTLETTSAPLLVVGVMPREFLFPSRGCEIWRLLDVRAPARSVAVVGRLAPGHSAESVTQAIASRASAVAAAAGSTRPTTATAGVLRLSQVSPDARRLLLVIVGAAICLLLTACANVASLELATAMSRVRALSVHLALGATRGRLVRSGLMEGLWILVPAVVAATALASYGTSVLAAVIPERVFESVNAVDLDGRALGVMTIAAVVTWLLVSVPLAWLASRSQIVDLLKSEGRTSVASRAGVRLRQALTIVEVALAVLLLCGGLLYLRTYGALVNLGKGFDSRGLAVISLTLPMQTYPTGQAREFLASQVIARLLSHPGVEAVSHPDTLPPGLGENYLASLEIDGHPLPTDRVAIGLNRVDRRFFSTLRIPIRHGDAFEEGAPPTVAIVDETFARAFWPNQDLIGHVFRISARQPALTVIGIAGHVRNDADDPSGPSERQFQVYVPRQPPPPPAPSAGPVSIQNQPLYGFIDLAVRLDPKVRATDLVADVRSIDSRFRLRIDWMDAIYARRFDDTRLATSVISGFGTIAFVLAMAGLYGVLAVLVASRRREIGIRMALGADRRAIAGLVAGSSARLVALGIVLGLVVATAASRVLHSQLFGVSPTDPATYALVALTVAVTALAASWSPARQAARVDPAVTLRSE